MSSYSIISILMTITILAVCHIKMTTGKDCTDNEEHVGCARELSCQPSCDHPGGKACPRMCRLNSCECKEGFVRDNNFTCIDKSQCNTSRTKMQATCGENEVAVACSSIESCQPSCDAPDGTVCPRMCSQHSCECKEGFVRDNNFTCIDKSQCNTSRTKRQASSCGENEVAVACSSIESCQPSCDAPDGTVCPRMCSQNSCVCKDGYIRASKNNVACIEKKQCSESKVKRTLVCNENEQYSKCVNPCQASCEEPNRKRCESVRCMGGCVCSKGYLRATNNMTSPCIQCNN